MPQEERHYLPLDSRALSYFSGSFEGQKLPLLYVTAISSYLYLIFMLELAPSFYNMKQC